MDKWAKGEWLAKRLAEKPKKVKLKKAKSTEVSKSVSGGKDAKRKKSSNKQK
jgi:hypothetical protein